MRGAPFPASHSTNKIGMISNDVHEDWRAFVASQLLAREIILGFHSTYYFPHVWQWGSTSSPTIVVVYRPRMSNHYGYVIVIFGHIFLFFSMSNCYLMEPRIICVWLVYRVHIKRYSHFRYIDDTYLSIVLPKTYVLSEITTHSGWLP